MALPAGRASTGAGGGVVLPSIKNLLPHKLDEACTGEVANHYLQPSWRGQDLRTS
jgi:hypothetical protein